MRLLVLLLAMYVLVLSGVPCEALCREEPVATAQGAPAHSGEQDDCKNCSPLSVCAACAGFTLPALGWIGHPASALHASAPARRPQYRARATREVAAYIWQPPRLA